MRGSVAVFSVGVGGIGLNVFVWSLDASSYEMNDLTFRILLAVSSAMMLISLLGLFFIVWVTTAHYLQRRSPSSVSRVRQHDVTVDVRLPWEDGVGKPHVIVIDGIVRTVWAHLVIDIRT